jgi:hypothetical protein
MPPSVVPHGAIAAIARGRRSGRSSTFVVARANAATEVRRRRIATCPPYERRTRPACTGARLGGGGGTVALVTDAPRWRATFDAVEREVGPRLQAALRSEQFAVAVGLATQLRRGVQQQASRTSRRVLHQLNLPAGTDVSRILTEVGQLRTQVRQLQQELDEARAELTGRSSTSEPRTARTTTARTTSPRTTKGGGRGTGARSQRARRADPA